jgi:hypothetical protein
MHRVEQTWVGAAGADFSQADFERVQRLLHFLLCMLLDFNNAHGQLSGLLGSKKVQSEAQNWRQT